MGVLNPPWSWALTAVGVGGLLLAGSKRTVGWAVGFGAQGLWIAYAIATRQWGFIASALIYGAVYARNWFRWRRESPGLDYLAAKKALKTGNEE